MSKIKDYLRFKNMNVSNARRNVPKDIKSLKSNFISTTPILCRMKVKPPCTRLFHNSIVAHQYTPHKRTNKKSLSALFQTVDKVILRQRKGLGNKLFITLLRKAGFACRPFLGGK